MRRGTTPRVTVTAPIDLTPMTVYLTFKQGSAEATLTNADFEAFAYADGKTTISASLTQEQTLAFEAGERVRVQVRAVQSDGTDSLQHRERAGGRPAPRRRDCVR